MILRSKYLVDWNGRVTRDAEIIVEGSCISEIEGEKSRPDSPTPDVLDLGDIVLLPGLVNAHTHLEITHAQSLVEPQPLFTDWLREVVRATTSWTVETFTSSLIKGIRLSIEAGTTAIGDISHGTQNPNLYSESGMRVCLFQEVIGFDPAAAESIFESLKSRIRKHQSGGALFIGICPHTPFTVSERLLRNCAELAHESDWRLCIHLAETSAEGQFIRSGTGEILDFRTDFGLPPDWKPPGTSPTRYLKNIGFLEQPATLVHCNYLDEEDFDIIGESGSSVVYCPRSHEYFRHSGHSFLKMLYTGINVALGTDSLVSSPTLSILDEMKFLRKRHPEINASVILKMATRNGLEALGLSSASDAVAQGGRADFVGVSMPDVEAERLDDPLEVVLTKKSEVVFSMVDGNVLLNKHQAKELR